MRLDEGEQWMKIVLHVDGNRTYIMLKSQYTNVRYGKYYEKYHTSHLEKGK